MLALIRGDGSQISISEQTFHSWKSEFPGLDVKDEIIKANAWMARNKSKSWKTVGGFVGWLKRAHASSPRVAADRKTQGQLAHLEEVQREAEDREKAEASIPRPDFETVSERCRQLRESLPVVTKQESKRVDWLRCQHTFTASFYGGGEWCADCGMYKNQWRAV